MAEPPEEDIPSFDCQDPVELPADINHKFFSAVNNPSAASNPANLSLKQKESFQPTVKSGPELKRAETHLAEQSLLSRLRLLKDEVPTQDSYGSCIAEIATILHGKVEELLETKKALKKEKEAAQTSLCESNESLGKMKAKLHTLEKESIKLKTSNKKESDEVVKLESKISESILQVKDIEASAERFDKNEQKRLEDVLKDYEKEENLMRLKETIDKADLENLINKEHALESELSQFSQEHEEQAKKLDSIKVKEQQLRQAINLCGDGKTKKAPKV